MNLLRQIGPGLGEIAKAGAPLGGWINIALITTTALALLLSRLPSRLRPVTPSPPHDV
ncbi:MAG TPA: hypothetical protein VF981_05775 [Gemmatimonadaceae bacterium]